MVPLDDGAAHKTTSLGGPSPSIRVEESLVSQEGQNMMKNMKPLAFKGKDQDGNKDTMQTFLQKWSDLHALRQTPDCIHALEVASH